MRFAKLLPKLWRNTRGAFRKAFGNIVGEAFVDGVFGKAVGDTIRRSCGKPSANSSAAPYGEAFFVVFDEGFFALLVTQNFRGGVFSGDSMLVCWHQTALETWGTSFFVVFDERAFALLAIHHLRNRLFLMFSFSFFFVLVGIVWIRRSVLGVPG